jgi:hypothetical protein
MTTARAFFVLICIAALTVGVGWLVVTRSAPSVTGAAGPPPAPTTRPTRATPPRKDRAAALLERTRAAVADYLRTAGAPPEVAERTLWEVLIEKELIQAPPHNPDAPSAVASRVVVVTTPGQGGDAADPTEAGWVWNSADEELYLAGVTNPPAPRE